MSYNYQVLGVKRVDFFKADKGEKIDGCQLWVSARTSETNWVGGYEVFKVWAENGTPLFDQFMSLRPGDKITGECDRKGRPLDVKKV